MGVHCTRTFMYHERVLLEYICDYLKLGEIKLPLHIPGTRMFSLDKKFKVSAFRFYHSPRYMYSAAIYGFKLLKIPYMP